MEQIKSIELRSADDVQELVALLREKVKVYGSVTRDELYSALGYPVTFEDSKWGWTNLDGLELLENSGIEGTTYTVKMPEQTEVSTGWRNMRRIPAKPPTVDELIEAKAEELQEIYDKRTAGDKTFEGFLYDYTKSVIASLTAELVEEFLFKGKKKS